MGKTSRTKSKEIRRKVKRQRKEAQRALYASYQTQGVNSKSDRFRKKSKPSAPSTISHTEGKCGNIGCTTCSGVHFKPFLKDGKPFRMPQWMWIKWVGK